MDKFGSDETIITVNNVNMNYILDQLSSEEKSYNVWYYEGSDTYIPCEENVRWFVVTTPLPIAADELALL